MSKKQEPKKKAAPQKAKEGHELMIFTEDKFTNVGRDLFAKAGEVVEVPKESVDRWIKRGGEIYDAEKHQAMQKLIEAETEEALAAELEHDGKVDHVEVEQAHEKVEDAKEKVSEIESEHAEEGEESEEEDDSKPNRRGNNRRRR